MKLEAFLVLPCLLAAACGAAVNTHLDNDNEDEKTSEYRVWGQFPWEQPGNPPPIFPPDDFLMPRTGRSGNQRKPSEDPSRPWRDVFKDYQGDNSDEYRIWGKFPWERPLNPPPFVPPSDTMAFSQIGRWWNQDYLSGKPERHARYSAQDDDDEKTDEYGVEIDPPALYPRGLWPSRRISHSSQGPFSQIGRWWNQEEIGERPLRPVRYSSQDAAEETAKKDHKLTRASRSVWRSKPWDKPWNPPPFLPPPVPGHD